MKSRVLRPLTWLGLMESRTQKHAWGHAVDFRKTPLFYQLLKLKVEMIGQEDARH